MCCDSWGCKESDMTELLNSTEGFWSPGFPTGGCILGVRVVLKVDLDQHIQRQLQMAAFSETELR